MNKLLILTGLISFAGIGYAAKPATAATAAGVASSAPQGADTKQKAEPVASEHPYPFVLARIKQEIEGINLKGNGSEICKAFLNIYTYAATNISQLTKTCAHDDLVLLNNFHEAAKSVTPSDDELLKADPYFLLKKHKAVLIERDKELEKSFSEIEQAEEINTKLKSILSENESEEVSMGIALLTLLAGVAATQK